MFSLFPIKVEKGKDKRKQKQKQSRKKCNLKLVM